MKLNIFLLNCSVLGFKEDTAHLERLRDFMHKYCNSFSGSEGESYMETATNYEKQRKDLEQAISINLQVIALIMSQLTNTKNLVI